MDIAILIYDCLSSNWTETNPDVDSLIFRYDEFDRNSPQLQILLENFPERSIWVSDSHHRVERRIKITIYLKLIRYDLDTVVTARTMWYNVKAEIDRILAVNKFSIPGILDVNLLGGWDDKTSIAVGRGQKTTKEPIVWKTEQIINTTRYPIYATSVNPVEIEPLDNGYMKVQGEIWTDDPVGYYPTSEGQVFFQEPIGVDATLSPCGGSYGSSPTTGSSLADLTDDHYQSSVEMYGTHWFAQSINPTVGADVSSIELTLGTLNGAGFITDNITVSIRASDGNGSPTGADLASATIRDCYIGIYITQYQLVFDKTLSLTANTTYCIVVRCPAQVEAAYVVLGTDDGNHYSRGVLKSSTDSGSTWSNVTGSDMTFVMIGV